MTSFRFERFTASGWLDSGRRRKRLSDAGGSPEQVATVREICERVATEGDAALLEYVAAYDSWHPGPDDPLCVPSSHFQAAFDALPADQRQALELAAERIRDFHRLQTFDPEVGQDGLRLLTRPVRRAGLYTPGGRALYPSTVLMTAIPARVAGVREIALATPPAADGSVPQVIMAAAHVAEVDAIYRMGGAQAVAAFAYGTESVPQVDVVAGPGNIYVTLAKKQVVGAVAIDGIEGPTEILVVADGSANATYVAGDLAAQMEHDPMTWGVLLTDSAALADAVEEAFNGLLSNLDGEGRSEQAGAIAAANGCIVLAGSLSEAVDIANDFAPEHLALIGERAEALADRCENAGAVFIGEQTPVSLGDYVIGPNHTLPTAGAARFASPLGVHTFLKRSSVSLVDADSLKRLAPHACTLARMEGLPTHGDALLLRDL